MAAELAGEEAGPEVVGLAAVKLASVGPGADGQAAWGVLAADSTCVHGAMAATTGGVFPPEEELGTGDSDLDLCLKLGAGRCCAKFRIRADARSSTLFLPDLLSSPSGIVQLLLGKFLRPPPVHREWRRDIGLRGTAVVVFA